MSQLNKIIESQKDPFCARSRPKKPSPPLLMRFKDVLRTIVLSRYETIVTDSKNRNYKYVYDFDDDGVIWTQFILKQHVAGWYIVKDKDGEPGEYRRCAGTK